MYSPTHRSVTRALYRGVLTNPLDDDAVGPSYISFFTTETPANVETVDAASYEFGIMIRPQSAGTVYGVRFWRTAEHAAAVGAYTANVHLRGADNTPYASGSRAVGAGETGWIAVLFSTPYVVEVVNGFYVASFEHIGGKYAYTSAYFTADGVYDTSGAGSSFLCNIGAGKYVSPPGSVPNNTFNNNNYWADVLYVPPA